MKMELTNEIGFMDTFKIVTTPIKTQPLIALFLAFAGLSGFGTLLAASLWVKTAAFCYMVLNLLLALIFVIEG